MHLMLYTYVWQSWRKINKMQKKKLLKMLFSCTGKDSKVNRIPMLKQNPEMLEYVSLASLELH